MKIADSVYTNLVANSKVMKQKIQDREDQIKKLKKKNKDLQSNINEALDVVEAHGSTDGADHKQWVIDQMAQKLLGEKKYEVWKKNYGWDEEEQEQIYGEWDEGIAP